jgi:hypothetical protein
MMKFHEFQFVVELIDTFLQDKVHENILIVNKSQPKQSNKKENEKYLQTHHQMIDQNFSFFGQNFSL